MSRPPINPAKTTAGIALDPQTLERVIPESKRPDGTVRKQIKIRPGFTPQEDVRRFRGTKQAQMDINTLPKGHIIGWVPPPTSTSTSGSSLLSKRAKKNAKKKANKNKREEEEEEEDLDKRAKGEDVPENWEDDGNESGPQGSSSGTPDTNPSMTTTTDLEPAKENQQVSPADVERDLSSKFDKLNVN
jgi:partner of Y14 and mago protein